MIEIKFFGQLVDIIGANSITVESEKDLDTLRQKLQQRYPALGSVKYVVAVNKKITGGNILLDPGVSLALLPPFSGG